MMLIPAGLGAIAHQAAAAPPPASPSRAALGNRSYPPYTVTSNINHVRHSGIRVQCGSSADWSQIRGTFHNFMAINGGESNGAHAFDLSMSVMYSNTIYPVTFGGAPSINLAIGASTRFDAISGLMVPAGGFFHMIVRTVGAVGTLNRLISHGARSFLGEGLLAGVSEATNYTDGSFGRGRTSGPPTIVGANITAATITNAGTGYSGATNVIAYDPVYQVAKTVGNSNGTTVSITNGTPVAGSAGWSSSTYLVHAAGGGFGQDTGVYGPAMLSAVPSVPTGSVLLFGDSIMRAYGSADGNGDNVGNYGIFERAINGSRGFISMALNGNAATAFALQAAHNKQYTALQNEGIQITDVIINLGTNDFASPSNFSAANVAAANGGAEVAGYWASRGARIYYCTILPRPGGGTGFNNGGQVDIYNAMVRAMSLPYQTGYIEAADLAADPADHTIWRTDGGVWTNDNIHPAIYTPDLARGVPAISASLVLPWSAATSNPVTVSPDFVRVSGATAGQKTVEWEAPSTLYGGGLITSAPVTQYRIRARRVDTGALVASTPITVSSSSFIYTLTGVPATAMTVTVSAINSAGESEESLPAEWTGT